MSQANLATALWRWPVVLVAAGAFAACGEAPTNVADVSDARFGVVASRPGVDTSRAERLEVCKTWASGVTPQDITVQLQVSGGTTFSGQFTIAPDASTLNGNPLQCRVIWENDRNQPIDYVTVTEITPSSGFTTTWAIETKLSPISGTTQPGPSYSGSGTVAQTVPIGGAANNPGALVRFVNTPIPLGSIGDRVWNDTDADGVQDAGEAGLNGWTVTIRNASNVVVGTATTSVDGNYTFPNLLAGTYSVCVTPLGGLTQTYDLDGVGTANCASVGLAVGQNRTDVDFGYRQPPVVATGEIGNYTWIDANGNGRQDVGEPALNGVQLVLGGAATANTTSASGGSYLFSALLAGNYTVTATAPAGFTFTTVNAAGTNGTNDSNGSPSSVTLATNSSSDRTIDFGFTPRAGGGQGCTPGYWKQSQHFDSWKWYTQTDMVDAVFGVTYRSTHKQNPKGPLTLLEALELNGNGNSEQLFRHGTAALLNAVYQSGVSSPYTAAQVIAMVRNAWNSGNSASIANATSLLSNANELGCPLN